MTDYEAIEVTSHIDADGVRTETVERWPERTRIAREVIDKAEPWFLEVHGDRITITVSNGARTYLIVGTDAATRDLVCELML